MGVLTAMLEPLCGWGREKEGDAGVRESLAEALMMLVSCMGACFRLRISAAGWSILMCYAPLLGCFLQPGPGRLLLASVLACWMAGALLAQHAVSVRLAHEGRPGQLMAQTVWKSGCG